MKNKLFATFAALALVAGSATYVLAWTEQDCIEVNYDHEDCVQYTPSPSPVVSPTPEPTVENPAPVDRRPHDSFGGRGMG